jgi:hypothetical protein
LAGDSAVANYFGVSFSISRLGKQQQTLPISFSLFLSFASFFYIGWLFIVPFPSLSLPLLLASVGIIFTLSVFMCFFSICVQLSVFLFLSFFHTLTHSPSSLSFSELVSQSPSLFIRLCVFLPVCLSTCLSLYLSDLSTCLSLYLSVSLPVCLSTCLTSLSFFSARIQSRRSKGVVWIF